MVVSRLFGDYSVGKSAIITMPNADEAIKTAGAFIERIAVLLTTPDSAPRNKAGFTP